MALSALRYNGEHSPLFPRRGTRNHILATLNSLVYAPQSTQRALGFHPVAPGFPDFFPSSFDINCNLVIYIRQ
ncbi:hypothetical protein I7I50_12043 [Histoplasma capsulatum G186AR]|uniref:Uncharacterized protein n=1 Tax=Ajellomyces capsulatus TaxID=5037 RepID=A0A8H7YDQ7_AJECA|nr:hypothetical protein I7I52_11651 [Histoplasma capsulatum]QSS70417.1 hypothetical protein I7I50_12043 [Histoplasma capsulatum G186AR]